MSSANRAILEPMTQKAEPHIRPALGEEQWREVTPGRDHSPLIGRLFFAERYAEVIAIANAALPDTDPRKIGWDYVEKIRGAGQMLLDLAAPIGELGGAVGVDASVDALSMTAHGAALLAIADILASYLPPREKTEG